MQRAADRPRHRHVPGHDQVEREAGDVDDRQRRVELGVRGDERAHEVVGRPLAAAPRRRGRSSAGARRSRARGRCVARSGRSFWTSSQSLPPAVELLEVVLRDAEELAQHAERQRPGEALDQLRAPVALEAGDEVAGDRPDPRLELGDPARRERPRHEPADAVVQRRVELDDVRHARVALGEHRVHLGRVRRAATDLSAPADENVRWSLSTASTSSWRVTTQRSNAGAWKTGCSRRAAASRSNGFSRCSGRGGVEVERRSRGHDRRPRIRGQKRDRGSISVEVVGALELHQLARVAGRARALEVGARLRRPGRDRRRVPCTSTWGTPSGRSAAGSACAGTASGSPPANSAAAPPPSPSRAAAARSQTPASETARRPVRSTASQSARCPPAEWPTATTLSPTRAASHGVGARRHVLERVREAAARADAPVLEVPRRPPRLRERDRERLRRSARVRGAPEAAVDHDRRPVRPGPARQAEVARRGRDRRRRRSSRPATRPRRPTRRARRGPR